MRFGAVSLCTVLFVLAGFAQERAKTTNSTADKYLISAKAGGVNHVEGDVNIAWENGRSGLLIKGDSINIGDKVTTGTNGKAEILLNPGSYVRIGGNSSFEFKSTDLEDVTLLVHRGSVIFEVFASNDFIVNVHGPDSRFVIIESGVYRMDVTDKETTFAVRRGRARVGSEAGDVLKGGRESTAAEGEFIVAKFDRGDTDDLDNWSKGRSKELAKMVASLDRDRMRNSLMSSYIGGRWDMFNSFGVWVWDPYRRAHCFLPFGWGWSSPYGYGYGRYLGWYNLPPVIYYPPIAGGGTRTPTNPTTPTEQPTTEPRHRGRTVTPAQPPFAQMQRKEGGSSFPRGGGQTGFPSPRRSDPGPVFVPSAPASAPAPAKTDSPSPNPMKRP